MTYILSILFATLGAILASFAGVISERLYTGDSWFTGRSHCNACNRVLDFFDLVPILSWLTWRGKCRTCRAPVPFRYVVAEVFLAFLFLQSFLLLDATWSLAAMLCALFFLMVIVLYDLAHTIVPMPFALLFIAASVLYVVSLGDPLHTDSLVFLIAGGIGFIFFLLHILSNGRWMGLGDSPVALGLSLLVGSQALPGLLFSFWIGGLVGVFILVTTPKGHRMGIEVPFVPFLAAGYLLALFTQWNPLLF